MIFCFMLQHHSYEKKLIIGYKGAARINEYIAKHKLDVCIVYGAEPKIAAKAEGDSEYSRVIPKVIFFS